MSFSLPSILAYAIRLSGLSHIDTSIGHRTQHILRDAHSVTCQLLHARQPQHKPQTATADTSRRHSTEPTRSGHTSQPDRRPLHNPLDACNNGTCWHTAATTQRTSPNGAPSGHSVGLLARVHRPSCVTQRTGCSVQRQPLTAGALVRMRPERPLRICWPKSWRA